MAIFSQRLDSSQYNLVEKSDLITPQQVEKDYGIDYEILIRWRKKDIILSYFVVDKRIYYFKDQVETVSTEFDNKIYQDKRYNLMPDKVERFYNKLINLLKDKSIVDYNLVVYNIYIRLLAS